ncbi:dGTP triphosphohydrolase [Mitsuokella multacida]|uniref:dGTP triphosphohydrolase n=1 Tax=Mitsuokella multacida TaxID=52226 RepID=UPI0022E7644B|nr:dNTP triphosphohydrolase [Mitsuokella multacida]
MKEYAARNDSEFLKRRLHQEPDDPVGTIHRDPFQRDRDRILHSRAFRRMMHKTQIFNANKGDHYRNRLTHTLEVAQIARSIGKDLGLNDELVEAIALGHDVGHTPFGHIGERTLGIILNEGIELRDGKVCAIQEDFKHNFQSLRVLDTQESRCKDYMGINLTFATREGILKHTKCIKKKTGKPYQYGDGLKLDDMELDKPSITLEGQTVAIADEIAQCTHDLEDGVRSGIIDFSELLEQSLVKDFMDQYGIKADEHTSAPAYETRSFIIKHLVGFLISDVDKTSKKKIDAYIKKTSKKDGDYLFTETCIAFSEEVDAKRKKLQDWVNNKIICSEEISISDSKSEYFIRQMFKAFYQHPLELPDYVLSRYFRLANRIETFSRNQLNDDRIEEIQHDKVFIRLIADHIGGMTDQYASRAFKKLYYPDYI